MNIPGDDRADCACERREKGRNYFSIFIEVPASSHLYIASLFASLFFSVYIADAETC